MPRKFKRKRPDGDAGSPSETRRTRQRQSQSPVQQEPYSDSNGNANIATVPNITVTKPEGVAEPPELFSATPFTARSQTSEESFLTGESSVHLERLDLRSTNKVEDQAPPTDGFIIPWTIPYYLHVIFDKTYVPNVGGLSKVLVNEPESYRKIEDIAERHVRESCATLLNTKELYFRYGSCKIVASDGSKHIQALTCQEDWKEVCTAWINLWSTHTHQNLRLEIVRDYFSLHSDLVKDETFTKTKRKEMHNLRKDSADGKWYIPQTDLRRLTSDNMIQKIIMKDPSLEMSSFGKEAFIRHVQEQAPKLLAMCVRARLRMKCLKKLLEDGVSDATLPLAPAYHGCHPDCGDDFQALLDNQGSFMAAEFMQDGQHQDLHPSIVVPIHFVPRQKLEHDLLKSADVEPVDRSKNLDTGAESAKLAACCGSGAYSNVYRVRIDPDHHRLSRDRDADFAMKEFRDRPYRAGSDFNQELRILDELRRYPHNHIVTHLATWTQGEKYCMLFPYAESNLREYMKGTKFGALNKENILWFLKQLRGLAHALKDIHNLSEVDDLVSSSTLPVPTPAIHKSGWHHDLKPENILYYRSIGSRHGTFKIGDFGSGKVHTFRSGSVNTRSPNGTLTYEPPEAHTEGATSRPYDMWSLGCVFLELLIWAVFDNTTVEAFASNRQDKRAACDVLTDDAFWQVDEAGIASLRKSVTLTIELLRKEISRQKGQPFMEVLKLVDCMLDLERRTRIVALDVWDTLDRIVNQKKVDLSDINDDSPPNPSDDKKHSQSLPRLITDAPDHRTTYPPPAEAILQHDGSHVNPHHKQIGSISGERLTASPVTIVPPSQRLAQFNRRNSSAGETTLSPASRPHSTSTSSTRADSRSSGLRTPPLPPD